MIERNRTKAYTFILKHQIQESFQIFDSTLLYK